MVAVAKVTALVCRPFVGRHALEIADGIADIKVVGLFGSANACFFAVFVDIFKVAEKEHAFASAVAEVAIEFHTLIAGIFAEILNRHAKFVSVELAVEVI